MLGYRTYPIGHIPRVNRHPHARKFSVPQLLLLTILASLALVFSAAAPPANAQQTRLPAAKGGIAELSAKGPQRRQGNLFIADDDVEIHYAGQHLRADHVEYNDQTNEALYFEAQQIERLGNDFYIIHQAWMTVCDPRRPKWQFYAPRAKLRLGKTMALINANFRLFRVPLIWMPYATAPAGPKLRQSGVLVPVAGNSTSKGFVFGDEFYWAPVTWMDTTLGAQYLSRRGSAERGQFRATPWENTSIRYNYFGVIDRLHQGGHEQRVAIQSLLPHNWRFVADINELSSLTFRLAFSDTFGEAINSEVRSSTFLTHNFRSFSFNLASCATSAFRFRRAVAVRAPSDLFRF